MAKIYNISSITLLSGTSDNDTIENHGDYVTINAFSGDDSIKNLSGNNVTIDSGAGNDDIFNHNGDEISINGGAGNDSIQNSNCNYSTITGGAGNDSINNVKNVKNALIDAGAGNDSIRNQTTSDSTINAGDGDDLIQILTGSNNNSINSGAGSDIISLHSNSRNNVIQYKSGDGNDIIFGLDGNETLSISGSSYSTAESGNNIIVTVDSGKISLMGAAKLSAVNIDFKKTSTATNSWKLNGTTATYGTANKTLITVKGVKSLDGISLSGKVVTVAASALNKSKVTLSGSGYTLKLADDVTKSTTKKAAFSLSGTTATYKSSYKTAGYTLASNGKSISYSKATTASTLATIKGAKSKSGLSISGNKITLKNSALNKKVSVSGGYEFNFASDYKKATITGSKNDDAITTSGNNLSINGGAGDDTIKVLGVGCQVSGGAGADIFVYKAGNNVIADYTEEDKISVASGTAQVTTSGDDVIFTIGTGKLTVTGGADKNISYVDSDGAHTYSDLSKEVSISGKTITLLEDYLEDSFDVADYGANLQTIDASAVQLDISITGNKLRNSIKGGDNNETLIGGKGNDTLTGGDGSDVFIYSSGDGNDVITDYTEEDMIKISSGTAKITKSGKDVIFTVGSGKITVKGAASKTITYLDAKDNVKYFPTTPTDSVIWTDSNTKAILRATYSKETFTASDYNSSVKTIDASNVTHGIKITGNGKANVILGGEENDTINGGKGNDTLQGGSGADTFLYANGDGKNIITDYAEEDTIKITKGTAKIATSGSDVVFTIGSGKITVSGAANKTVNYIDANGKKKTYGTSASNVVESWFVADDDNFATSNDLSALVQNKSGGHFVADNSTALVQKNNLFPSVTYSSKK